MMVLLLHLAQHSVTYCSQFTVPLSGTGKLGGNSNILVTGTFNGTYRFTFNDQTLAYNVVPLLASPYATLNVAGTFNGWNTGLTNMLLITNSWWQCDTIFPATTNVQFKFAANGTWAVNWGDNSQTQTNPPLFGTAQSSGGNIFANVTSNGVYRFTFNDQTLAYSLQSLQIAPPRLNGQMVFSNRMCSLNFTNFPGTRFTVLGSTNLNLPASNWTVLGSTLEIAPGQFQFTDPAATSLRQPLLPRAFALNPPAATGSCRAARLSSGRPRARCRRTPRG